MTSLEAFLLSRKYGKIAKELGKYVSKMRNEVSYYLEDSSLGNPDVLCGELEGKYVELFQHVSDNWKKKHNCMLDYAQTAIDTTNSCMNKASEKEDYYYQEGLRLEAEEVEARRKAEEAACAAVKYK